MKLTAEQIKAIAVGVARVEAREDSVYLLRFTKEQEELYKTVSDDFYKKTYATAGVRLEFVTDSKSLAMECEVSSGSSRKYFSHGIFVDGKRFSELSAMTDTGIFGGRWTLPEGEKKICIYFPWSTRSSVRSITIDDGASLAPVKKAHTMIIFGDSITHGYDSASPERSYASKLADALDADARNKGIGAEIFRPELASLHDGIEPDYISVAYGTNDWNACTYEEFTAKCRGFYMALSENYPNAQIFALTPIWRKQHASPSKAGEFCVIAEFIEKLAAEIPNLTAINCFDTVPADLTCFSPDGVHPNDKGFSFYADGAIEKIKAIIK
ncbi:MAG: SGNH/GDSL hydrolase family protein [Ruminococcaceae bacterium]|nr:SGNH/GDSL hydrolase family protein [Oscillospiraceae bacterium]